MFAYHGRYYRIDLGRLSPHPDAAPSRELAASTVRAVIGGTGLATQLLLSEAIESDPLSAEAPLAITFSPLIGSPLTTSAKFAVVARSPLTMRFNDSLVSSGFALSGKRTGADALVLVGRCEVPSVLLIDNDQVRLAPAGSLWGAECEVAERQLREQFGAEWRFQVIGPAGERLVRFASASHDGRHAGRGGHGAVLGAKGLKAIGVRGDRRVEWAAPARLNAYAKSLSQRSFGPATAKYRELGTAANLLAFNRLNVLPSRNFQRGSQEGVEQIAPESLSAVREKTRSSCAACTIGCEHLYSTRDGGQVRLEYENLFALGPLCGVTDPDAVLAASQRCDQLGLDTISMGGVIAFGMQCRDEGLLDEPWLRFGDAAAVHRAIELTARREGVGDLLAEGSRAMAERIGGEAPKLAVHVKGLELPGYEPRGAQTLALGMAVGARGADHNRSGAYEADFSEAADRRQLNARSAPLAIEHENRAAIMDSMILCKFVRRVLENFYDDAAEMLRLTTGFDYDGDELRAAAGAIVDAKKRFNQRVGWTAAEDTLPKRFLDNPLPDDPQAVIPAESLAAAVADYYRHRGWDADGRIREAPSE